MIPKMITYKKIADKINLKKQNKLDFTKYQ